MADEKNHCEDSAPRQRDFTILEEKHEEGKHGVIAPQEMISSNIGTGDVLLSQGCTAAIHKTDVGQKGKERGGGGGEEEGSSGNESASENSSDRLVHKLSHVVGAEDRRDSAHVAPGAKMAGRYLDSNAKL